MFIYDNGKVCVFANTRCGHTSMFQHFGMEPWSPTSEIDVFINTNSRRVLILRNPYDRINSAYNLWKDHQEHANHNFEDFFHIHTDPYLIKIPENIDIEIIDFYRLTEYIANTEISTPTYSNYADKKYLMEKLPEIIDWEVQEKEYLRYIHLINSSKKISPEEWHNLTK